jgi:hypothetical protein
VKIPREMEIYRRRHRQGGMGDHTCGMFVIPARGLLIIASAGEGWDHVSVSREDRCPTWDEMQWVRESFLGEDEAVMQLHPPLADHVNQHPNCLQLWKPQAAEIPLPPKWMLA